MHRRWAVSLTLGLGLNCAQYAAPCYDVETPHGTLTIDADNPAQSFDMAVFAVSKWGGSFEECAPESPPYGRAVGHGN